MIFTEAQRQIRDMARDFARERLATGAAARDRESRFPREELREMGELGFLGMLVPEAYGGAETGAVAYALALEEIAAGDGPCSTIMSVHNSVGCLPILNFGSEEQKQRFLPKLASGEWIGGFALTEPQAGSDASNLKTRARREGDEYVIDGAKQFITSGKNGHVVIVFALTDPTAGKKGITAFIVPTDTPGYEVVRVEEKLGLHASDTCQIAFSNLRIPAELRLGAEGEGYKIALAHLEGGRIGIRIVHHSEQIDVVISDTGIGIPIAERSKVFERFYKVDESHNKMKTGNGLGLAIVHKIVTRHKGSVTIGGNPDGGTTVTVTLPHQN